MVPKTVASWGVVACTESMCKSERKASPFSTNTEVKKPRQKQYCSKAFLPLGIPSAGLEPHERFSP